MNSNGKRFAESLIQELKDHGVSAVLDCGRKRPRLTFDVERRKLLYYFFATPSDNRAQVKARAACAGSSEVLVLHMRTQGLRTRNNLLRDDALLQPRAQVRTCRRRENNG